MAAVESNLVGTDAPVAPNPGSTASGDAQPATQPSFTDGAGSLDTSGSEAVGGDESGSVYGGAAETQEDLAARSTGGDEVIKTIFDQLLEELPEGLNEDEVFAQDGFYKKITPEHIAELPPVAKQIVHNFRRDYTQKRQRDAEANRQAREELERSAQQLALRERDLVARQRAMVKMAKSGEFLKKASLGDDVLPHPDSPEGISARAERAAARAVTEYLKPVEAEIEAQTRYQALMDFEVQHPEMRNESFRNEVIKTIKTRKEAGFNISTPDAYHLVKSERDRVQAEKAEAQVRVRERRARANGARAIGKSSGAAGSPKSLPKFRNAAEAYEYMKRNKLTTDQLRQMS